MKICVIIILHLLHIAWSYRVHHLDANEANQVVPMLRRVLQGYEIPNYAEVRLRKSRHRFQPVGKSMFVKRIIPHGYKTGEYEYDSRLNTVFKPLFRYHVGTPSTEHEMSMVKGMKPYEKTISQDDCPGDLVKLGNMCVSPIGHRKLARRSGRHPKRKQYY
ncbi:hypothetical protein HF086_008476 [Spodoptera exigua]|uniref:Uncharacterized protein n=1 Tax=Spodoptera exigua TaxID=7107 RepID=A0A922MA02_SPOEX|nr:hypothetical protein HF086_008476 [Spodoptera exigua]